MGQWRFCQCVERTPTAFAAVAWQIARLPPMHDVTAAAMGATYAVHPTLPELSHKICSNPVQWPHRRRCHCRRRFAGRFGYTNACNARTQRLASLTVIRSEEHTSELQSL